MLVISYLINLPASYASCLLVKPIRILFFVQIPTVSWSFSNRSFSYPANIAGESNKCNIHCKINFKRSSYNVHENFDVRTESCETINDNYAIIFGFRFSTIIHLFGKYDAIRHLSIQLSYLLTDRPVILYFRIIFS